MAKWLTKASSLLDSVDSAAQETLGQPSWEEQKELERQQKRIQRREERRRRMGAATTTVTATAVSEADSELNDNAAASAVQEANPLVAGSRISLCNMCAFVVYRLYELAFMC